jgi:hypothetical protein
MNTADNTNKKKKKKKKKVVAVVTGSSSGIGFETSLLLARTGSSLMPQCATLVNPTKLLS